MNKAKYIIIIFFIMAYMNVLGQLQIGQIKKTFIDPGSENKPWVYWYIMDGNLNKAGITTGLEAMKKAGIGGVVFMEVDYGLEKGKVLFMSPEWRECFKYAVKEAERLGMEFTVGSGPGWAGSGGPWITAEESMLHLVSSSIVVNGAVDVMLPRPQPEPPYFGMESLDENMKKARDHFYKDVCVLAYPKTKMDQPIDHIKERALYIRRPYSSDDNALSNITMPSPADKISGDTGLSPEKMVDVSSYLQSDGRLVWKAPAGEWVVYRFGITTTGANTRPAPASGYGFECSKLDSSIFDDHFKNFHKKLIDDLGITVSNKKRAKGWNMLHIDSWEMGAQNWSYHFSQEFRKRRDYDMTPYLPAYSGQIVGNRLITERFLWDMRLTAQELMLENYAGHFKNLAHQYGMGLSIEPYDMNPASDLALGAVADVPMCEYWTSPSFITAYGCAEAVSVAHTNNKNIVAAESMTGGHAPVWTDNPGNMKGQVDWALAYGINRMAIHVAVFQPYLDRFPGMTLGGIGSFYNTTQTWWSLSNGWHKYLTRCQFLLRQGKPVADILFLNTEGAPVSFSPPVSAQAGTPVMPDRKGFNFDGCDPLNLIANADVKNGKIIFPGNMSYSILVLPNTEYMTPELLTKIDELIKKGATAIGFPPQKSPSLVNYPKCDEEVRVLVKKMWGNDNTPKKIGKGLLFPCSDKDTLNIESAPIHAFGQTPSIPPYIRYSSIEKVLHQMGLKEDFLCDKAFRYIHRKLDNGDVYFVSNTLDTGAIGCCTFRAKGKSVTLLNPMDGKEYAAKVLRTDGMTTTVKLQMEPNGSVFVMFDHRILSKKSLPDMTPELIVSKEIDTPWTVGFNPRFGGPVSATFNKLIDWSTSTSSNIKYYSGTAKYVTNITLTPSEIKGRTFLDLGTVEVVAGIKINGKDMGVVWKTPYRMETTGIWKSGNNTIEIEVANLWTNRLIGDQSLPESKRYTWTTCNPYNGTDQLRPSGLIGPVTIQKTDIK